MNSIEKLVERAIFICNFAESSLTQNFKSSGIYAIHNIKSNKIYVGQSSILTKRFVDHRQALRAGYHDNAHLQKSWNKYEEKDFNFLVIELCNAELLDEKEQSLIDIFYGENCYNMRPCATSLKNFKHTEDCKEAQRKFAKSLWENPDFRKNQSEKTKERWLSETYRKERSEERKKMWKDPEFRKKRAATVEKTRIEKLSKLPEEKRNKWARKMELQRIRRAKKKAEQ